MLFLCDCFLEKVAIHHAYNKGAFVQSLSYTVFTFFSTTALHTQASPCWELPVHAVLPLSNWATLLLSLRKRMMRTVTAHQRRR